MEARFSIPVLAGPGATRPLYSGYRFSFPGVERPGRSVDIPTQSSAEVKERVELYHYSPLGLHGQLYGEISSHLWRTVDRILKCLFRFWEKGLWRITSKHSSYRFSRSCCWVNVRVRKVPFLILGLENDPLNWVCCLSQSLKRKYWILFEIMPRHLTSMLFPNSLVTGQPIIWCFWVMEDINNQVVLGFIKLSIKSDIN